MTSKPPDSQGGGQTFVHKQEGKEIIVLMPEPVRTRRRVVRGVLLGLLALSLTAFVIFNVLPDRGPQVRKRTKKVVQFTPASPAQPPPVGKGEMLAHFGRQEWDSAFKLAQQVAGHGDREADFVLGWLLAEGKGTARNEAEAATHLGRALEERVRVPQAAWKLAWLYERGLGVPRDLDFSRQLREDALVVSSENTNPDELLFLAKLWEEGRIGQVDPVQSSVLYERGCQGEQAILVLQRATAQGHAGAMERFASFHYEGKFGMAKDPRPCVALLVRAGQAGSSEAWLRLAELCDKDEELAAAAAPGNALEFRRRAAALPGAGAKAFRALGKALWHQKKGPIPEAAALLVKAWELEPTVPAVELAEGLDQGLAGLDMDPLEAAKIFRLANEPDRAKSAALRAIEQNRPGAWVEMAEACLVQGRPKGAEQVLRDGVKRGDAASSHLLGQLLAGWRAQADDFRPRPLEAFPLLLAAAEAGQRGALMDLYLLCTRFREVRSRAGRLSKVQGLVARQSPKGGTALKLAHAHMLLHPSGEPGAEPTLANRQKAHDMLAPLAIADLQRLDPMLQRVTVELGEAWLSQALPGGDQAKARTCFRKGAALDLSEAWQGLARVYREGLGLPKDTVRAAYCMGRGVMAEGCGD